MISKLISQNTDHDRIPPPRSPDVLKKTTQKVQLNTSGWKEIGQREQSKIKKKQNRIKNGLRPVQMFKIPSVAQQRALRESNRRSKELARLKTLCRSGMMPEENA